MLGISDGTRSIHDGVWQIPSRYGGNGCNYVFLTEKEFNNRFDPEFYGHQSVLNKYHEVRLKIEITEEERAAFEWAVGEIQKKGGHSDAEIGEKVMGKIFRYAPGGRGVPALRAALREIMPLVRMEMIL